MSKRNSAPGPDGVTYATLRNLKKAHEKVILEYFNQVWITGEIPQEWRMAHSRKIPKSGKEADYLNNLRPI